VGCVGDGCGVPAAAIRRNGTAGGDRQRHYRPSTGPFRCTPHLWQPRVLNTLYARWDGVMGGTYYYLDLTAPGRQEEWVEPKGRATAAHEAPPFFSA